LCHLACTLKYNALSFELHSTTSQQEKQLYEQGITKIYIALAIIAVLYFSFDSTYSLVVF